VKKRTHSRRNRAVALDLDLYPNLTLQLKEKSDDCDFLLLLLFTYTMAVYMGYMLHNTRKMGFRYLKKAKGAHKKTSPAKGEIKGEGWW
jgi:hypothetical protein